MFVFNKEFEINEIVLLIYVSASKDVQSQNYFRLTQINIDSIGCTSEPEQNILLMPTFK